DLAKDGISAHRAMVSLIAARNTAIFERVKAAVRPSDERLQAWLADLGSPAFATREAAQRELVRVCDMIEPALRRALKSSNDAEALRRLNAVLENIPRLETRPEKLRELRVVET